MVSEGLPRWAMSRGPTDAAGQLSGDLVAWGVSLTLCGIIQRVVTFVLLRIQPKWIVVLPAANGRRTFSWALNEVGVVGLLLIAMGLALSVAVVTSGS
jgi:hypothetical protein